MLVLIKRFIRAFIFYWHCVGLKNVLTRVYKRGKGKRNTKIFFVGKPC